MLVVAEGPRARTALTPRFSVSSTCFVVSFKRAGRCAATVGFAASLAGVLAAWPTLFVAAGTIRAAVAVNFTARVSPSIVVVPVIKGGAPGVVPVVIMNYDSVMPIGPPMMPAPTITSVVANAEADSERKVRAAIPYSRIRILPRPRHYRVPVNNPRIVRGDVNDLGTSSLDDDVRVLRRYGLLLRSQKIARFLRTLAHHLYGVHHVLFLVVVSVAERRRPGEVFVHVAQDGWKCSERLDARVPRLLVHSLSQSLALQIRMRVHPLVCLDDLLGKRRRSKDLGDKRIWIQRNRRYQLLQLLGSLLNVLLTLRGLRRVLLVLSGRQVLRPSHEQQSQRQQGNQNPSAQAEP